MLFRLSIFFYLALALNNAASSQTVIFPSNIETSSNGLSFGLSMDSDGDLLVVGARGGNENVIAAGGAYVFRKNGTEWSEETILVASDAFLQQEFAHRAVSIFEDYILVGADGGPPPNDTTSGAAYIFKYEMGEWTEKAKLIPSDGQGGDHFGDSADIHNDYSIVGAHWSDTNGIINAGAAYIFKKDGDEWIEEQKLIPADLEENAVFGKNVVITDTHAIVAATKALGEDNVKTGAVYIFTKNGNQWIETQKIFPSDGADNDWFGQGLSISNNKLIIGTFRNGEGAFDRGYSYIYEFSGGEWVHTAKLTPMDIIEEDKNGGPVALLGDYALMSNINGQTGNAYLYHYSGSDWEQVANLQSPVNSNTDRFGQHAVALTENDFFVSAIHTHYNDTLTYRGAVYLYDKALLLPVDQLETTNVFNLFPNPVNEILSIEISPSVRSEIDRLEVVNTDGRLVANYKLSEIDSSAEGFQIPVKKLSSGIYFIRVLSGDTVYQKRFVKF